MNIVAIDLGKFNSMCCFFDTTTQKHSFWTAETSRTYLRTVLERNPADLVVMEACGPCGWISDLCKELGIETLVCSTNEEAWKWRNVKRKTDRDDALKLARLAMLGELKPVHIPTRKGREHRSLIKYRKSLDQRINRFKNSIRSLFIAVSRSRVERVRGTQVANESTRSASLSKSVQQTNSGKASWTSS